MQMISIIIPTYNEEKNLPKLIKSIKQNKNSKYEIIVVDNGSTDKTKDIAKKEKCKFLFNPKKTMVGHSRNMGAKKAKGKLLYFIDADWEIEGKDHLRKIENFFQKNKKARCGVPILKGKARTFVQKIIIIEHHTPTAGAKKGAYIYKKDFFQEIGGFGPELGFGEDRVLASKLTHPSKRINAVLRQGTVENIKKLFKQGIWYGKGFNNYRKASGDISQYISMLFWSVWMPLILLSFFHTFFRILLSINLFLMILLTIKYTAKSKKALALLIPLVKIVRSVGEVYGILAFALGKSKKLKK